MIADPVSQVAAGSGSLRVLEPASMNASPGHFGLHSPATSATRHHGTPAWNTPRKHLTKPGTRAMSDRPFREFQQGSHHDKTTAV
jgi:hypothetical protein